MANEHQTDWVIYQCYINDKPGITGVDLGLAEIAPMGDKPELIVVSVAFNDPTEDGFPQGEEFGILAEISDMLTEHLKYKMNAHFVGRTNANGVRDLYFYCGNTVLYDRIIADVMTNFPDYRYEAGIREDKEWSQYFDFLFPSKKELQLIQNEKIFTVLEEQGDVSEQPREIHHWIYFEGPKARAAYWDKIAKWAEGFKKENEYKMEDGEYQHCLHISHTSGMDKETMDSLVMRLYELADEMGAEYDGWETQIMLDISDINMN